MDPKKGRRVRKIEVPTVFLNLSWGTQRQISSQGGRRGRLKRGRRHNNSNRGRRQGGRRQEWRNHTQKRGDNQKKGPGQKEVTPSQSGYKKGHITNLFLTDSDEETIVDFVKDHEELYDKTSEQIKDKARKEFLWEQFAKSHKLSDKVCKTWFDSQRTRYEKLTQSKSGEAPKEMLEHQT